jgi:hypothetical protein
MITGEIIDRNVTAYAKKLKNILDEVLSQDPNEATLRHRVDPCPIWFVLL